MLKVISYHWVTLKQEGSAFKKKYPACILITLFNVIVVFILRKYSCLSNNFVI